MFSALLRSTFGACAVAAIGAMAGCAGNVAQPSATPHTFSIDLAYRQRVTVPEESLTVSMIDLNDSRCPTDAVCVWAGDVTISLQVGQAGSATELLTIRARAPLDPKQPAVAVYGKYRFSLISLEPMPSQSLKSLDGYHAVVEVSTAAR